MAIPEKNNTRFFQIAARVGDKFRPSLGELEILLGEFTEWREPEQEDKWFWTKTVFSEY